MYKPIFEQFAAAHPDVEFKHTILDEADPDVLAKRNIMSVPTVVFLKGDKEEARLIGVKSKNILEQKLYGLQMNKKRVNMLTSQ
jgi:thiol:disulfide interchange protein